ncbi:MAG: ParB/RepB/Spo0J family partition protein [Eubacteriales bacterium]
MTVDTSKLKSAVKKIQLTAPSHFFGEEGEEIIKIPLEDLLDFPNHPFQVTENQSMTELQESIQAHGVANPILVRPHGQHQYEIIAGHRRTMASRRLGLQDIPAIVRELDDEEAVFFMVDTNIQRETLLPSEKAFAYKMKLEALRKQAGRPKKNGGQIGHHKNFDENGGQIGHHKNFDENGGQIGHHKNFDENGGQIGHHKNFDENGGQIGHHKNFDENGGQIGHHKNFDENGGQIGHHKNLDENGGQIGHHKKTRESLAENSPDNGRNIQRYIRLTHLSPTLLLWVDQKKIPFLAGVDLSYLREKEQYYVALWMEELPCSLNLVQAKTLKQDSESGKLDESRIMEILEGTSKEEKKQSLQVDTKKYFPPNTSKREMEEVVDTLLRQWFLGEK